MPSDAESDGRDLAQLRQRIDAIDAAMHHLLIERGTVIASLIAAKGTDRPGTAFRPAREADMMRRLVARHQGALPLATVEHIWREIIGTFTHIQAPFDVAIDTSTEPDRMRDLARFAFGFSVGLLPCAGAAAVVAEVAGGGKLGLVARKAPGAWWRGLVDKGAPRIMALLPFVWVKQGPADLPAFVLSLRLADPTPPEVSVFAVSVVGGLRHSAESEIVATSATEGVTEALIATRLDQSGLAARLRDAGAELRAIAPVGGFARGIAVDGGSTLLYEAAEPVGAA